MRGRSLALAAAGAAVIAGAGVAGGLVGLRGGGEPPSAAPLAGAEIQATTALVPRQPLFGDTVRAVVDVTLDRERVDPASVRIATGFAPWQVVAPPERSRRDVGRATYVRTVYSLRCVTGACLPGSATQAIALPPARVSFRRIGDGASTGRSSVRVSWPLLVVSSRFAASRLDTRETVPFRADLVSLPTATYRLPPAVLVGGLGVLAALCAGLGAALVALSWPRRPLPEPTPEPEPELSPLEQALALLEESARAAGASARRRALELVAEELEEWGDDELSSAAKVLAWSPGPPPAERTAELAARVRAELEVELLARAERERNGAQDAS